MNNSLIFTVIATLNFLINLDHGILPAIAIEMEKTMQFDDEVMGLMGSLVYVGIVLMSILSGHLIVRFGAKNILLVFTFLIISNLVLFSVQIPPGYYWIYLVLRFLIGVF